MHAAMGAAAPSRKRSWQIEVCNKEMSQRVEAINII
jgi:hypothetical protein